MIATGGLLTPLAPALISATPVLAAEYKPWVVESGPRTDVLLLDQSVELSSVISTLVLLLSVATA